MSGVWVQERRAPGRRTSSLHRDVRFLAVPEHGYPAASATYGALKKAIRRLLQTLGHYLVDILGEGFLFGYALELCAH